MTEQPNIINEDNLHQQFVDFITTLPRYEGYFTYLVKRFAKEAATCNMPVKLVFLDWLSRKFGDAWFDALVRKFQIAQAVRHTPPASSPTRTEVMVAI